VPLRGRTNTPLSMSHIYRFAARLRGMEDEAFTGAIADNYHRFLDQG